MSDEKHLIKRFELARLIGGDDASAVKAADIRLKQYERDGLVKPEVRREPFVASPFHVMRSVARDNPKAQLDTFYEARRFEGLPPLHPPQPLKLFDEYYYGADDAKRIAPLFRETAPLRAEFCEFAFGARIDANASPRLVTPAGTRHAKAPSLPIESAGSREAIGTKDAIKHLDALGYVSSRTESVAPLFKQTARHPGLFDGARKDGSELWWKDRLETNFHAHGARGKAGMRPRKAGDRFSSS